MIRITCPCGQTLQANDENAGGRVRCPSCQTVLSVPVANTEAFMPSARVEGMRSGPAPEAAPGPPTAQPVDEEGRERYESRRDRYDDEPRRREPRPAEATSGKAVFAFVLGLLALVAAGILGFTAPIWTVAFPAVLGLGNLAIAIPAISQVNRSQGRVAGFGLALTGLILGAVAIPMFFPGYLLNVSTRRVREAAARVQEQNNLKQIALALHMYHDTYKRFPTPGSLDKATGKPLLSWRVLILPYLEQEALYRQFNLNEPWDSPRNLPLAERMPDIFKAVGKPGPPNHTTYQFLTGPSTLHPMWPPKGPGAPGLTGPRLAMITDGSSNTFMVVESSNPVLWTKPDDIAYDSGGPRPALGWSIPDRFHVALCDGSVRTLSRDIREETLRNLINPQDGNDIPWAELERP